MSQLDVLTELERDAITEAFNIGIGKAGASLSEMVGKEVLLSVPQLSIITIAQANAQLNSKSRGLTGIKEYFDGAVAGNAILLFPADRTLDLIRLMYPMEMNEQQLRELEDETLVEIGNILLNATLSSLADILREEVQSQIPEIINSDLNNVFLPDNIAEHDDQHVLKLDMDMTVKDIDVKGNMSFLIIIKSIDNFKDKLSAYFGI